MRKKNVLGRRRPSSTTPPPPSVSAIPLLSTSHSQEMFESETEDDHRHAPMPDSTDNPFNPVDLFDNTICICCDKDGGALVCSGTGCPVTVHATCIGSESKFDESGNFYCPYCWYKRALDNTRKLREKAMMAKKALSSFLDKGNLVHKDAAPDFISREEEEEEEEHVMPVNEDKPETEGKESSEIEYENKEEDIICETVVAASEEETSSTSPMSENNDSDSDYEATSTKKPRAQNKASSVRKSLLQEGDTAGKNDAGDENEEGSTSSDASRQKRRLPKQL